jgi:hypothetical protein
MTGALEREWYVDSDGQQFGPIVETALQAFIREGLIRETDLVWTQGYHTWILVSQLLPESGHLPGVSLTPPPLPKDAFAFSKPAIGVLPPPLPREFETFNSENASTRGDDLNLLEQRAIRVAPRLANETSIHIGTEELHDSSTPQRQGSGGYLARHWRGQLSLPISYWFNGILGYLIATLAVALVGASSLLRTDFSPTISLLSIIGVWTITLAVLCWQVVGTWRAATRHSNSNAKSPWPAIAKVSLCVAAVSTSAQFFNRGLPQLRELYGIYLGDEEVGKYAFRVLREGAELEFSGGITFGAAQEFARFVDAMGALKIVHLNSKGGRIGEAQRIADLIKTRNLDTYVANSCLSACTIIFLSGRNRFITSSAKVGFHQPSFAGLTAEERIQIIRTEELRLQRFGLSAEFAKHANEAPPDQIWTPSAEQLIRERVATRIVDPSMFALSGIDATEITFEKTETLLRGIPIYAAIDHMDSRAFHEIVEQFVDGLRRGKSTSEINIQIGPIIDRLLEKALPSAPEAILTEYVEMAVKHMKLLKRESPALCYFYLNPNKDASSSLAILGSRYPEVVNDQNRIKTKVFGSYQDNASSSSGAKSEIDSRVAEVYSSVERRLGQDAKLILKENIESREYDAYCGAMTNFYEEILRLPPITRGAVLQALFQH